MALASEDVKLLGHWPSPYVLRARIALNIKAVEYEFVLENVLVAKSELLQKSNPVYQKIPVLIHGDRPICESLIIVQYIDEAWNSGSAILPSDPYDRAVVRFWASYLDDKFLSSARAILFTDGEAAQKVIEEAIRGASLLEEAFITLSKGQKFFGGEKIGYLDIALGGHMAWFRVIHKMSTVNVFDESRTPNLAKWVEDFSSDPAVKDVLPETDKLVEFAKFLIAKFKAPAKN